MIKSFDIAAAIITVIFLLVVLSYYVLLFIKRKKSKKVSHFKSISIIIPAHNEEPYIKECIQSAKRAAFANKEIIVVDDGSTDNTYKIASRLNVKVIRTKHIGKSAAINKALGIAKGEVIAIVDADSVISKDSLVIMASELGREKTGAVTGAIKVKNRKKFIGMWLHIEQLYNSLMRSLFTKVNANIATPGPLSLYRKDALNSIGGFSTKGYAEDLDIAIRLIRKGYAVSYAEGVAETNMPYTVSGFVKQRRRFILGNVNILRRHLQLNRAMIDIYTMPLLIFSYVQAIIMGLLTLYQVISGYLVYFVDKGVYFNWYVFKFFFTWFSMLGFVNWTYDVLVGNAPLTFIAIVGILSTLLTYPLYVYAIAKYDKRFDIWHLIPFFFMGPFWLVIMVISILNIPFYFAKQYNIWEKVN